MRTALALVLSVAALAGCSSKKKATTLPPAAAADAAPAAKAPSSGVTVDRDGKAAAPPGDFQPIYFAFDSSELLPEAREELGALASWLGEAAAATVTIEGHADARGTAEYNVALGERRARVIREYLVRLGVAERRLSIISFGEERPAVAGDGEATWARNRRGELVLSQK
jgi:peptidoglycan-associated lipoprotein